MTAKIYPYCEKLGRRTFTADCCVTEYLRMFKLYVTLGPALVNLLLELLSKLSMLASNLEAVIFTVVIRAYTCSHFSQCPCSIEYCRLLPSTASGRRLSLIAAR